MAYVTLPSKTESQILLLWPQAKLKGVKEDRSMRQPTWLCQVKHRGMEAYACVPGQGRTGGRPAEVRGSEAPRPLPAQPTPYMRKFTSSFSFPYLVYIIALQVININQFKIHLLRVIQMLRQMISF